MDLSIVIPSYNHARYLANCLDSIYLQKDKSLKFEVILIDDASPDNSLEVAETYAKKLPIRIFSHEKTGNKGAVATINEGISLATGKYVAILNSDDEYLENHFEVIKTLITSEPDVILARPKVETMPGAPGVAAGYLGEGLQALNEFGSEDSLFLRNYFMTTSAIVAKTKVAKLVGGFDDLKFTYDWDFALRCMDFGSVSVSNEESMIWREHASNTISTGSIDEHHFENATLRMKQLVAKTSKVRRRKTIGDWLKLEDSSTIVTSTFVLASIINDPIALDNAINGKPLGRDFYQREKEAYYRFVADNQETRTLSLFWDRPNTLPSPSLKNLFRQLLQVSKQIILRIWKILSNKKPAL